MIPPYMSPAPTPDTIISPAPAGPPHAESSTDAQLRADLERLLLKLSQDLYEMEVCAGDVVPGQEERVPAYLFVSCSLSLRSVADQQARDRQKLGTIERDVRSSARYSTPTGRRVSTSRAATVLQLTRWSVIDRHRNPHGYTKATLGRATGENQYALGRVLGLEVGYRIWLMHKAKDRPDRIDFQTTAGGCGWAGVPGYPAA